MGENAVIERPGRKDATEYIREYLLSTSGKVVLSDKQHEIYVRIKTAWTLLVGGEARSEIENVLINTYEVSEAQAWRDIRDATRIFGEVQKADKEGMRHLILMKAEKAYRLAELNDDVKGMNEAIKNMVKITGLEREDPDLPDFAKLEAHNYIIVMPPEQQEALRKMLTQPGSVDLNTVSDIEYEELSR